MAIRMQYKGPFPMRDTSDGQTGIITLPLSGSYKIGVSIGEKDFMLYEGSNPDSGGIIINFDDALNTEIAAIKIGRTFTYETGGQAPIVRFIRFQNGAPVSTVVDVLAFSNQG